MTVALVSSSGDQGIDMESQIELPEGHLRCGGGSPACFHTAVSDAESPAHSPPDPTQASSSADTDTLYSYSQMFYAAGT